MKGTDITFENIGGFVEYITQRVFNDEGLYITVVSRFKEMKDIITEMIRFDDVEFDYLRLESPIISDYEDEYILSLFADQGTICIDCDRLKTDGEYTNPCGDETYLFENCSSKIIPLCEDSDLYFVAIEDDIDSDSYDQEIDKKEEFEMLSNICDALLDIYRGFNFDMGF